MSYPSLRHFLLTLTLALVPLLPATPAHATASPSSGPALSAATIKAIRDSGPPVMEQAASAEANAPLSYSKTAALPAAKPLAVNNPRLFREVMGFAFASSLGDPTIGYPSWNMSLLSTVAYFGIHIDWTGAFSGDSGTTIWNDPYGPVPGFIAAAHSAGTKVVLTIEMFDSTPGTRNMCSALQRANLTIQQTVAQVNAKGIDGVNVDYESDNTQCTDGNGVVQSSQSLFTSFVANLRAALPAGSYLSVDTYSGAAGYRSGATYYGFFDIGALNNYVDSFMVMAYDMEYDNGLNPPMNCSTYCLGPTSPLSYYYWNQGRASAEYTAVVPASKVIMGMPYYGRKECVAGYTPSNAPPNALRAPGTGWVAEGYLDASTENGYALNSDYHTHREVHDTQGNTEWDTFTSSQASCTRELYWDDTVALGNKYDLVINNHLRGIGIFALNYGGGAPELWNLINLKFGQCSQAAISADHSVPQIPGTSVTFSATALCAGIAQYRFWLSPPSGGWTIKQDYSGSGTWSWNTSGLPLGTYRVEVDARNLGANVSYDTTAMLSFRLALCVTPTVSADKTSPQLPATTVTISATVTCQGTPQFQFVKQSPGGAPTVVQDFGGPASFSWSTAAGAYGNYGWTVNVRTAGTTIAYESYLNLPFAIASCINPALTRDKTTPQPTGVQVKLSGTATCDGPAQFRFMVQPPGGVFATAQDFSSSSSYTWAATGAGGTYGLELDAKSSAAPVASLWSALDAFELVACSGAAISVAPASPQVPGTSVQVTGSATCLGTPQYRFWTGQNGIWKIAQDYGPASTFSWNTTGTANGSYGLEVDARNTGAIAAYETTAATTFTLAAPACTAPVVQSDKASPQPTGTTITFTATTTTCPQPVFRFYTQAPDGSWSLGQDYAASPTFSWSAAGPGGTWRIEVDVRDATRPVSYDQYTTSWYVITACSGAILNADKPSPQVIGATINLIGAANCTGRPEYRFDQQVAGGWTVIQAYSASNVFHWYAWASGTYRFEVDIRDVGASTSYETYALISFVITGPCTSATLAASPPSAGAGATVVLTASAGGCPTPMYRFWVGQNGGWTVVQDYGTSNTFSWNTAARAPGVYGLEVDVRGQGSSASYEALSTISYSITGCSAATLTADKTSPQAAGTTIMLTAGSTCPGSAEYRFWIGQNGGWTVAQEYSPTNTYAWNTAGKAQGTYGLEVDVRDHGSSASYEAVANLTYRVATTPCGPASLTPNPPSPGGTGAHVTLTASTAGCANPQYRFWVSPPGAGWSVVQDYSATNTFSWTATGAPGTYRLEVDVRDQSSTLSYESVANISYVMVACSATRLSTDRTSPQPAGATVTLTGSATCAGTPEYRFWVRDLSGRWSIAQDYSPSNTFAWNTTGLAPGTYGLEVDVRDQGTTVTYESVANSIFSVA